MLQGSWKQGIMHRENPYTLQHSVFAFATLAAKFYIVFYIVAGDVKALYPCLYRDTVTKALQCALEKHSDYSAKARKIIVELNKICLNNAVTQYGDQLYIQKKTES